MLHVSTLISWASLGKKFKPIQANSSQFLLFWTIFFYFEPYLRNKPHYLTLFIIKGVKCITLVSWAISGKKFQAYSSQFKPIFAILGQFGLIIEKVWKQKLLPASHLVPWIALGLKIKPVQADSSLFLLNWA